MPNPNRRPSDTASFGLTENWELVELAIEKSRPLIPEIFKETSWPPAWMSGAATRTKTIDLMSKMVLLDCVYSSGLREPNE
jgi:hypothetical protein